MQNEQFPFTVDASRQAHLALCDHSGLCRAQSDPRYPGRVFSLEQLLDTVRGHDVYVEARTVEVHILRLRKALNVEGDGYIVQTVRSAGYGIDRPSV